MTSNASQSARLSELNPHRALVASLFAELLESERAQEIHPDNEASRLGRGAPVRALRGISSHARSTRDELRELLRERSLGEYVMARGEGASALWAWLRRWVADGSADEERAYRTTLLGLRHGVDLVRTLRSAAEAGDDGELAALCTEWLQTREPLVAEVAEQLEWFGWHPEAALAQQRGPRALIERIFAGLVPEGRTAPDVGV